MNCPICFYDSDQLKIEGLNRDLNKCRWCGHIFIAGETHSYTDRGMGYFRQNCNHQGIQSAEDSHEWDVYVNTHLIKLNQHGINLQPGSTVVELGCLEGQVLNRLKTIGVKVVGFEPNKGVASLHDFIAPYPIAADESISDGSVDAIFSFHVFEHIDDIVSTVQKCYRLLKPGGKLFFEVPIETDWWNPDHVHFFNTHSISVLMKDFHRPLGMTGDHFTNCHGIKCEQIQVSGVK